MEKISIVKRRHRSRDLETAALMRARMRESNAGLEAVPSGTGWTAQFDSTEEFSFEIELTPEQLRWLRQERRNGTHPSSPEGNPVIFHFNIKHPGHSETLTAREVCGLLKISRRTLYRYVKAGDLTAFRVGRGLRFLRQDVLRFLSQRRIES
jgi:excisionase family DNA binding protein